MKPEDIDSLKKTVLAVGSALVVALLTTVVPAVYYGGNKLGSLDANITNLSTQITDLGARTRGVETRLGGLEITTNSLERRVMGVEQGMTQMSSRLSEHDRRFDHIDDRMMQIGSRVGVAGSAPGLGPITDTNGAGPQPPLPTVVRTRTRDDAGVLRDGVRVIAPDGGTREYVFGPGGVLMPAPR